MKRTLLLSATTLLLCSGCMSGGIAEFQKAMAGDPATVTLDINTVYGKVHLVRVGGATNETKTVAPDGTITIRGL